MLFLGVILLPKYLNSLYVFNYHMINKNILKKYPKEHYTEEELYEAYKLFFGTLGSEPRLKIINLLRKGKKTVSRIMKDLNLDQTVVSHNLARLKRCGFVTSEVEGKFRCYKLDEKTARPLIDIINNHMEKHCIHILRTMKGVEEK